MDNLTTSQNSVHPAINSSLKSITTNLSPVAGLIALTMTLFPTIDATLDALDWNHELDRFRSGLYDAGIITVDQAAKLPIEVLGVAGGMNHNQAEKLWEYSRRGLLAFFGFDDLLEVAENNDKHKGKGIAMPTYSDFAPPQLRSTGEGLVGVLGPGENQLYDDDDDFGAIDSDERTEEEVEVEDDDSSVEIVHGGWVTKQN